MTDWNNVLETDAAVPADRPLPELIAELSQALRSPDPVVRDDRAYSILAKWISRGVLDPNALAALGDEMAQRFGDPEIQARTFAPLILDCLVTAGAFSDRWVDAFVHWYPAEADLRGHDPELGWLHAAAHGADLLGTFGRSARLTDPAKMLNVAMHRLLAPTEFVWRDREDDRLARALALTLTRPELTAEEALGWLAPIDADFAISRPGPPPAHVSNAVRTLRMLYLLADRGVSPSWRGGEPISLVHGQLLKDRLAAVKGVS